MRFALQYYKS